MSTPDTKWTISGYLMSLLRVSKKNIMLDIYHQHPSILRSPYLPPPYVSAAMHGGDVLAINLSFFLGRFPFDWNKIGWVTLLGVSTLAASLSVKGFWAIMEKTSEFRLPYVQLRYEGTKTKAQVIFKFPSNKTLFQLDVISLWNRLS